MKIELNMHWELTNTAKEESNTLRAQLSEQSTSISIFKKELENWKEQYAVAKKEKDEWHEKFENLQSDHIKTEGDLSSF